jgi:hypothetical protein
MRPDWYYLLSLSFLVVSYQTGVCGNLISGLALDPTYGYDSH